MAEPTKLKKGDRCPNCGGELVEAPEPTAKQRAAASDKMNPVDLPPHYDSASEDQRSELGALYRCRDCGYRTRFPIEKKKAASTGGRTARREEPADDGDNGSDGDTTEA